MHIEKGRVSATLPVKFFRNETQPRQERAYSFPSKRTRCSAQRTPRMTTVFQYRNPDRHLSGGDAGRGEMGPQSAPRLPQASQTTAQYRKASHQRTSDRPPSQPSGCTCSRHNRPGCMPTGPAARISPRGADHDGPCRMIPWPATLCKLSTPWGSERGGATAPRGCGLPRQHTSHRALRYVAIAAVVELNVDHPQNSDRNASGKKRLHGSPRN